jgi:hypothetical protein
VGPVIAVATIAVSAAACGGGTTGASSGASHPTSAEQDTTSTGASGDAALPTGFRPGPPYPGVDHGHLVPASATPTTVPVEIPSHPLPIASSSTLGQQILIKKKAFVPETLYATIGRALVWTNESGAPTKIQIYNYRINSPTIAPGAQFVWTPPLGGVLSIRGTPNFGGIVRLS